MNRIWWAAGNPSVAPKRWPSVSEEDEPDMMDYMKRILTAKVYDVAVVSELQETSDISENAGVKIWLKREDRQRQFTFKIRGAYNMMAKLPREQLDKGVIAASAGNHAQGVALAAKNLNCKATLVMPVSTPEIKSKAVEKLGATVVFFGDTFDDANEYALKLSKEKGLTMISDHPDITSGQGTIGVEIMHQMRDPLDAIFIPVGSGSLIAGVAVYVKNLYPEVKIIGVEPVGANAMTLSLEKGERVILDKVDQFADGVALKEVGAEPFPLCQLLIDDMIVVTNEAISASMKDVYDERREIMEPSGALSIAGAQAYIKTKGVKWKNVVAITSGANMDFNKLKEIVDLADIGNGKKAVFASVLPETSGSFKLFCQKVYPLNIRECRYRYNSGREAVVLYSVGISDIGEVKELKQRMESAQIKTSDLTKNPIVNRHLRNLIGGRSSVKDEVFCRLVLPERPGALIEFLDAVSPRWNVTLFDYNYVGETTANILVGLQIGASEMGEFHESVQRVGFEYNVVHDYVFDILVR